MVSLWLLGGCFNFCVQILGASETLVRGRRKVLVNRVQNLIDLSDKLRTRIQQCQKKQN